MPENSLLPGIKTINFTGEGNTVKAGKLLSSNKERQAIFRMDIEKIRDFLETDVLSVVFSSAGLKYLSLKAEQGTQCIELKFFDQWEKQDPFLRLILQETLNFLETGKHKLPLDLAALTNFQQSVFGVVSKIEPGRIMTYKGIAELLGKPGAAQAVGSAVAKNPVSYFLPTHRVLPQRGLGRCRTGAGHLREKFLEHEGHDLSQLMGNYTCTRKKCCLE